MPLKWEQVYLSGCSEEEGECNVNIWSWKREIYRVTFSFFLMGSFLRGFSVTPHD